MKGCKNNTHSNRSHIAFDELFKPRRSPLFDAGKNPFEPIRRLIQGKNYEEAVEKLVSLFRSNADVLVCYEYLLELLSHINTLNVIARHLPYLIARTTSKIELCKLAIKLAEWYSERHYYFEAIGCYAKALQIEESKEIHRKASKLFITFASPFVEVDPKSAIEWGGYLDQLESLEPFWLEAEDREFFYKHATKKMNACVVNLSDEEQAKYSPLEERMMNLKDFKAPVLTTTERYWEAFNVFTAHFAKIDDVKDLQQKALTSFMDLFQIFLKDAFLLLGGPTPYDIRAEGSMGQGEIFPHADLECVILVSQKDKYFKSLQEILTLQFLSIGKKIRFRVVLATENPEYSLLKSISLVRGDTSSRKLFIDYQTECWKQPFDLPKLDKQAFNKEWKDNISLADIQNSYKTPLIQLLIDLVLYHKIEHTNLLDDIDKLKGVFTENSLFLLKESVAFLYHLFLTYDEDKLVSSLPEHEIAALQKCHWLVFSPLYAFFDDSFINELKLLPSFPNQPLIDLETIAHIKGIHLIYETAQFHRDIKKIFVAEETKVKVKGVFCGDLYLHPDLAYKIFDQEGNLISSYDHSAHRVCVIQGFHLKQKPTHPLMEYAIHSLCSRIAGDLTPCVELVRFDIGDTFYPVLISRTISGGRWQQGVALDLKQWTRMLLCAILTRPGDGSLSNYVVKDQKIYCIDNDLSFVEPAEVSWNSTKVNFFSLLFCMKPLNTLLDQEVLKEFVTLDRAAILNSWIEDVIQKEEEYTSLFSEPELESLYQVDRRGNSFTPKILFRKGALATLDLQFWRLQALIRRSTHLTPENLLKELISIHNESVGVYVSRAYTKAIKYSFSQMKYQITSSAVVGSMTKLEYHKAALGKQASYHEIEKGTYSPADARKEFFLSLLKNFGDAAIINHPGETTIQANFQALADDPSRQTNVLMALAMQPLEKPPQVLILNYCLTLDVTLLTPFLHAELDYIDLSHCPKVNDDAASKIHDLCPNLKHLCLMATGITEIKSWGWGEWSFLEFPKLEYGNFSQCNHLHTLQLKVPALKTFIIKE